MKKPSLLTMSLAAHGALAFGLFVSGIWHIEQLDPGRHTVNLAVLEPPAPSGSPATPAVMPKMIPKQHIIRDLVQPVKKLEVKMDVTPEVVASTPGNGQGSGSGSGDNKDGPPDGPGTCKGDGCAPAAAPLPPKPPECLVDCGKPEFVPPRIFGGLRYAGNTNPTPSDVVKQQMVREDHLRVVGAYRVCLGTSGEITSVTRQASTKYAEYDDTLLRTIRTWQYHPYTVKNVPVPACGVVTFIYSMK